MGAGAGDLGGTLAAAGCNDYAFDRSIENRCGDHLPLGLLALDKEHLHHRIWCPAEGPCQEEAMRTFDVFGIQPEVRENSYVDRGSLDQELNKLLERQQTHVAIRGASKSGKSWLRQRALKDPIVVQCRISYTVADIYRDALARLDIRLEIERTKGTAWGGKVTAAGEAGLKLLAKVEGGVEVSYDRNAETTDKAVGKDVSDLEFIAALIRGSGRTLVIEDFHYLPVHEQANFAFDLKTLWDYRTFVVVVGVWISENMLITLNPDLSDRIEEISVTWSTTELKQVFKKGCAALNLRLDRPEFCRHSVAALRVAPFKLYR